MFLFLLLLTVRSALCQHLDPRCPLENDPNYVVHLPHEDDCTKFYKCNFGVAVLFNCPPDQHWSIKLDRCDWPEVAECNLTSIPTITPPGATSSLIYSSTMEFTTVTFELTTSATVSTPDPRCPLIEDPENPVHLPHEDDCTKFYTCDNGNSLLSTCPEGTHWSVSLNRCEWPVIAGCEAIIPDERCPLIEDPENPVFLPHEDDCTKFYVCNFGQTLLRSCYPGLHWRDEMKWCDYPELAQCDVTTTDETTVEETHTQEIETTITERRTPPTAPTVPLPTAELPTAPSVD